MFFKKKPSKQKMDAIADSVAQFASLSIQMCDRDQWSEENAVVVNAFMFGAIDFMAQSNGMGDTETVAKIAGLTYTKYLGINMDTAWNMTLDMVSLSNEPSGKQIMKRGADAFSDSLNDDSAAVFVLKDLLEGMDYYEHVERIRQRAKE